MAAAGAEELVSTYRGLSAQSAGAEQAADAYDPKSWDTFIAENGPHWDGTTETWEPFKEWFSYQADQAGLTTPAASFIAYADGQADKIAVFSEYGVTIAAPRDGHVVIPGTGRRRDRRVGAVPRPDVGEQGFLRPEVRTRRAPTVKTTAAPRTPTPAAMPTTRWRARTGATPGDASAAPRMPARRT
jgi:hypothetical protein